MAFTGETFVSHDTSNNNAPRMFSYRTADDNLAAVKAANYFDPAAAPSGGYGLSDRDMILVDASDGATILHVLVSGAGAVTVAAANDFV